MPANFRAPKRGAVFACPSEQESLFEYIAELTYTRGASQRIRLLQDFPGSVP
jgi:hypothetical protein